MRTLIAAALIAAAVLPAAAEPQTAGIPGSFDPRTRIFVPQAPTSVVTTQATASVTGTVVYRLTVAIASSIPTSQEIACMGSIMHGGGTSSYMEMATVTATRSGSTATCTVSIPYKWSKAETASVIIPQITVSAGERRYLSHSLTPIALPASGATTTITQSLRL